MLEKMNKDEQATFLEFQRRLQESNRVSTASSFIVANELTEQSQAMFGNVTQHHPASNHDLYNAHVSSCEQQVIGHQTAGFGRSEVDQSDQPMTADILSSRSHTRHDDMGNDSEIRQLANEMNQFKRQQPAANKANSVSYSQSSTQEIENRNGNNHKAGISVELKRDSLSGLVKPPRNPTVGLSSNNQSTT